MLQIGSHAPCSDIWSIGLRNEDVDLVLTINADVKDTHNDRSMTRSNIVTKTRIFSGIFAVFVLACSLCLSNNCWICKKITKNYAYLFTLIDTLRPVVPTVLPLLAATFIYISIRHIIIILYFILLLQL